MSNTFNVLLLDDENMIHTLIKNYTNLFYKIYSAYTYDQAEKMINDKGVDFFNIFLCDLLLDSEKNGLTLIDKYCEVCKTIVISGYLSKEIINELMVRGVFGAHQKPIKMGNLLISMNSIIRCNNNNG